MNTHLKDKRIINQYYSGNDLTLFEQISQLIKLERVDPEAECVDAIKDETSWKNQSIYGYQLECPQTENKTILNMVSRQNRNGIF